MTEYPYVWRWRRVRTPAGNYVQHVFADRAGTRCRVICRGTMNTALVEFEVDRSRAVVSRNALRKADS